MIEEFDKINFECECVTSELEEWLDYIADGKYSYTRIGFTYAVTFYDMEDATAFKLRFVK